MNSPRLRYLRGILILFIGGAFPVSRADESGATQPVAFLQDPAVERVEREPLEKPLPEVEVTNPLKRLLQDIFRPPGQILPRPAVPKVPGADGTAQEISEHDRDYIDRSAPRNPQLEKLLNRVQRHLDNKSYDVALDMFQQILELPNDRVSTGPGESRSIRDRINEMISALPPDVIAGYQRRYDGLARQLWDEARRSADSQRIAEIASRYFHTRAGLEASNYLFSKHLERGEWALAAVWLKRLNAHPLARDFTPAWFLKAAFAFRKAGMKADADKMLGNLNGLEVLQLAGRAVNPQEWLERSLELSATPVPVSENWSMWGGVPSRTAVTQGEAPVLVPRWKHASTNSPRILESIDELTQDLRESGRTLISSLQPLVIGNRTVFRTMRGISVVDFESGTPRWVSRENASPEQLLTGQIQTQPDFFGGRNNYSSSYLSEYQGSSPDSHPLTGLLYRDALHGLLSSDGRQVFVIEQQAWLSRYQPGYYSGTRNLSSNDPFQRNWETNKLVAYNLESGRLEWEVGGESLGEKIHLPLAGYYFLGAPLVSGNSLYAIGERESEIRVFCLDAETGNPRWSTLIGYSLHSIDQDFGRRWWTAQPALADGVLVCPNTCGWLVAVDTISHEVLWEQRFKKAAQNPPSRANRFRGNEREGLVENRPLSDEWVVSHPIVAGNRVVHAPREENVLIGLDLVTGQTHWSIPRGDALALITADEQHTILLGQTSLRVVETSSGKPIWALEGKDFGRPTGTPACTPDEIYLPTDAPGLLRISRTDGKILDRFSCGPNSRPLGNLVFHDGRLLSLDSQGATVFDLRTTFREELAARRRNNPDDAWSLLQEAQQELLEQRTDTALASLRKINVTELPEQVLPRYRGALAEALIAVVKNDLQQRDEEFLMLSHYLDDEQSRIQYWELKLDRLAARGQSLEAFEECLRLSQQEETSWMIPQADNPRLRIRFGLWLAGQIRDLRGQASETEREKIDARIESLASEIITQDAAARNISLELFASHPAVEPIYAKLAESARDANELTTAEYYYLLLSDSESPDTAIRADVDLAKLYHAHGRDRVADVTLGKLKREYGDFKLDGRPVSELADDLREAWNSPELPAQLRNDWGEFDLTEHKASMNYQIMQQYRNKMKAGQLPFLRDLRFDYNSEFQRLQIHAADGGRLMWSVPLRQTNYISNNCAGHLHSVGHLLAVLQGDSLTVLSPLERKVLWSRPLKSQVNLGNHRRLYYNGSSSSVPAMQSAGQLVTQEGLLTQSKNQPLVHLSARYICVRSQRDLQVFDTTSGDLLWTHEKLSPQASVIDLGDEIYLTNPSPGRKNLRLRLSDASPLPTDKLDDQLAAAIDIDKNRTITVETSTKRVFLFKTTAVTRVRAIARDDGRELWSAEFDSDCWLSKINDRIFSLNRKLKTLDELDLTTGLIRTVAQLDEAMKSSVNQAFVVDAGDRLYLTLNGQNSNRVYGHYYLSAMSVNGTFVAIERESGRMIWQKQIGPQFLLLDFIEDSPVLVFSARRSFQQGNLWKTQNELLVLDPQDGRQLIESSTPYNNDLQAIHLNHSERKIFLMSYNTRTILQAVPLTEKPLEAPRPERQPGNEPAVSGSNSASTSSTEASP